MILYLQRNQISQQVWTICTSYVHLHDLVRSLIFNWFFPNLYIQWIQTSLQILMIYTFNVHNFSLNFHDFVLSMKPNFSTSPDYLYIYCTHFPWNFHDLVRSSIFHQIFMNLCIQRIRIFKQIRTICTSNVYNFPLNFHDLVHSSIFHWILMILYIQWISNFSTNFEYLYI